MPTKYIRKKDSNRGSWTSENLSNAIEAIRNGLSIRKASIEHGVPRKTLERRFKSGNITKGTMGKQCILGNENETKLAQHIKKCQKHGFPMTRDDLRTVAYKFANQLGIKHSFNDDEQKAGYDWLQLFLSRHPDLSIRKAEGLSMARSLALNKEEVFSYFNLLEQVLNENELFDKPGSIFNVDETGLQLNNRPGQVIAEKGSKAVSNITFAEKGETITVVACCNAEGVFIPPVSIMKGKNKKKEFEDNMPPGAKVYMSEKSAYINTEIFFIWLQEHFLPRKPTGTILLILDGHASHCNSIEMLEFAETNGIILICLPSHTTHYLQPLDRAVFKSVKNAFYNAAKKWMKNHPGRKLSRLQFGELLNESWGKSATPENAIAGFRATGVYPFNPDAVPSYAFTETSPNNEPRPMTRPIEEDNSGRDDDLPNTGLLAASEEGQDLEEIVIGATSVEDSTSTTFHINQPSTSTQSIPTMLTINQSMPSSSYTPTKVLNDISPLPSIKISNDCNKRSRPKLHANVLTSPENLTKLKLKRRNNNPPKTTSCRPKPKSRPKMRTAMRVKGKKIKKEDSSSSEEEVMDIEYASSDDLEGQEDECVGCGEDYHKSKQKSDWIQCIRCHRWLHETCTSYVDVCQRCGNLITKKK